MNATSLPANASSLRDTNDIRADRAFRWLVTAADLFVLVALAAAALSMLWGGRAAFEKFGLAFFWRDAWDPVLQDFGALVPIYGTLVTALLAMIIAVPVSFGIAMFLTEIAPKWMRGPVGAAIELLAGIPSIIYGMWGLFVLVPVLAEHRRVLEDTGARLILVPDEAVAITGDKLLTHRFFDELGIPTPCSSRSSTACRTSPCT